MNADLLSISDADGGQDRSRERDPEQCDECGSDGFHGVDLLSGGEMGYILAGDSLGHPMWIAFVHVIAGSGS